ncbi:MAG TPA: phosphoribosylanthranilate isomerase [Stenomitos sp.]
MTRIKICGLTRPEDVRLSVEAGAHAVGFVHVPHSKRYVDRARLQELCRAAGPMVTRVAVIADLPLEEALSLAQETPLMVLQLHGQEDLAYVQALRSRLDPRVGLWRAVRGDSPQARADALAMVGLVEALLLDSDGGSGTPFDWKSAEGFEPGCPVLLAGGLTPENVGPAIQRLQPFAVDVSSGVEGAPGRKDPARLHAFFTAVRTVSRFAASEGRV